MPGTATATSLAITNPLVKYRALVATKKIRPDPAQHRLALQLQKLYYRLKDYNPELEYRHRLDQISQAVDLPSVSKLQHDAQQRPPLSQGRLFSSFAWRTNADIPNLALTPTIPIQESALTIRSPQGMLLYGEVGRGKSMLLDLFADSLPSRKKKRWHFNTFMLETFRRLEQLRMQRANLPSHLQGLEHEHSILSLAKDTVSTSPILFLDEFQLPDRAASKLLNSFLTSFFHLGGVLIATSNRMPEELAKAAGVEHVPQSSGLGSVFGWSKKRNEAERVASTDFGAFLDVLKARCEVWEMEGERDWRRDDLGKDLNKEEMEEAMAEPGIADVAPSSVHPAVTGDGVYDNVEQSSKTPQHYHLIPSLSSNLDVVRADEVRWNQTVQVVLGNTSSPSSIHWSPSTLIVYNRPLHIPAATSTGYALFSFSRLCATNLGPADYISLASHYHTLILDHIPILSLSLKNEARRFITLLDALYECKCRLLIRAEAGPDELFFPETRAIATGPDDRSGDEVYQETLAEIYQDQTSPFRPNISSYRDEDRSASPTQSLLNPNLRSVLADEDADFGPVYGNGRGHGASSTLEEIERRQRQQERGPDFTKTGALIGEDERFAYKRARSRIWEMCGRKWWSERPGDRVEEWWRAIPPEARFWEKSAAIANSGREVIRDAGLAAGVDGSHDGRERKADQQLRDGGDEGLFKHGASPFRTTEDPPPRFGWQHAWGMVTWGRKAGEWGKGVEGKREK
jgi:peroxisome-assembly ATPase